MRLIFIRHAEPDYENNTLTEKGFREAELLAQRTAAWKVDGIYSSPLGRALQTAEPTLKALNMKAQVCDWLQEFSYPIDATLHPFKVNLPWDFSPEYLDNHAELYNRLAWSDNEIMRSGNIGNIYKKVCDSFDEILAQYGYIRHGVYYDSPTDHIASNHYMKYSGDTLENMKDNRADQTTLVFFCHLGVMSVLISHLLNLSPSTLWHNYFVAPSSVTVINAEERNSHSAYFRCQTIGDTSHLTVADEPISYYGYFTTPFQG